MNNYFPRQYESMNEQQKMTVQAISKLFDGLKFSDVKEILDCLQATLTNMTVWSGNSVSKRFSSPLPPNQYFEAVRGHCGTCPSRDVRYSAILADLHGDTPLHN